MINKRELAAELGVDHKKVANFLAHHKGQPVIEGTKIHGVVYFDEKNADIIRQHFTPKPVVYGG